MDLAYSSFQNTPSGYRQRWSSAGGRLAG